MRELLVKRSPEDGYLHVGLFGDYLSKGMYDEAQLHAERVWTLFGFPQVTSEVHRSFLATGYRGAFQATAKEMEHLIATNQFFLPVNLAKGYAALGDKDRAFYWLEESYRQHDIGMFSTDVGLDALNTDFMLDPLRSDPRFKDLLRRVGLPELQLNDAIASGQQNGRGVPPIHSLAVLPLQNLSADPNQEYFSDGMTDALITDLAQIGSLKVISRTSIMHYKKTDKTLREIASELNVDGIVEGTVQRSGDRVRITAQLIQVTEDRHLWASSYEREMRDVFALERDVTEEIARQVRVRLRMPNDAPLTQPLQVNPKALDAYLQGNYHLTRGERSFNDEEKRKAAEYFQEAIDVEPNFTPAYIGLANAHDNLRLGSREDTAIRTKAAEKALILDRKSSEALGILANVKWANFEWSMAETEYRQAVELNPNSAMAHDGLGDFLAATGRLDEALREAQIAQALDPSGDHLPQILQMRGEYDRAIDLLLGLAKGSPEDGIIHYDLFRTYAASGKQKEAVEEMEKALTLFGMPDGAANMRRGFSLSGYSGAIRELARGTERLQANNEAFLPENLAAAYTALGEKDRAFYWLEQAYEHHDKVSHDWGLMIVKVDPLLAPLRSDPRFKDLLRRVGLPP
jgi:TolB-like protein/Flp pilus assembly protein TadD